MAIPRLLHYCWFGPEIGNELMAKCQLSWTRHLRDYTFLRWSEDNVPMDHPYVRAAYQAGRWSKVSNFVRLWALQENGGLYLDTDVEVFRSLLPLHANDSFVGFQLRPEQFESDPCWVNNAVLGAVPGSDFIDACLRRTVERFESSGTFEVSSRVTSDVLRERGLTHYGRQDVRRTAVYPVEAFYPYHWGERFHPGLVGDEVYAVHHWNFSWRDCV